MYLIYDILVRFQSMNHLPPLTLNSVVVPRTETEINNERSLQNSAEALFIGDIALFN